MNRNLQPSTPSHLKNHAKIEGDPVLSFENKLNDSHSSELLTIADVARLLKLSETTVRRLQQRRLIPFIKVGGSIRFSSSALVAYLENQRVESIDQ